MVRSTIVFKAIIFPVPANVEKIAITANSKGNVILKDIATLWRIEIEHKTTVKPNKIKTGYVKIYKDGWLPTSINEKTYSPIKIHKKISNIFFLLFIKVDTPLTIFFMFLT